jgi:hypothetical protein
MSGHTHTQPGTSRPARSPDRTGDAGHTPPTPHRRPHQGITAGQHPFRPTGAYPHPPHFDRKVMRERFCTGHWTAFLVKSSSGFVGEGFLR